MTKKFLIYSLPFLFIFIVASIFEPWVYQNIFASSEISDTLKDKEFKIIAHRGASGYYPENTLIAIEKAIELGADMIDVDVRMTKDGAVVLMHDETVDRTTNGTGEVSEMTLAEIKALDAGSWKDSKFSDQQVPTLKEVLDLVDGRVTVLIEIKHHQSNHSELAEHLVEVIQKERNGYEWCILQSYEEDYLEFVHEQDPKIQTKKLLVGEDSTPLLAFYMETKVQLGRATKRDDEQLDALNPPAETLSAKRIFRMHARGFKVYTYLINEKKEMIKMLNAGVDGIITDFPDRLMEVRKEIEDYRE